MCIRNRNKKKNKNLEYASIYEVQSTYTDAKTQVDYKKIYRADPATFNSTKTYIGKKTKITFNINAHWNVQILSANNNIINSNSHEGINNCLSCYYKSAEDRNCVLDKIVYCYWYPSNGYYLDLEDNGT